MTDINANNKGARFDQDGDRVVVERLIIDDSEVAREARRWTTGERGPVVDDLDGLAAADLTKFVVEALSFGARAIAVTAMSSDTHSLELLVKDVGGKTMEVARQASEATQRVTNAASEALTKAAHDTKKAITEADEKSRKEFTTSVTTAKQELVAETRRLFGGDHPELLEKLKPVLEKFGTALEAQVRTSTTELLEKATKQLDPSDPTSPLAKHQTEMNKQQDALAKQIEKSHTDLAAKVDDLSTAIKVQEAKTTIAKVTPIKGGAFEAQMHGLMQSIAGGLGDEYEDTTIKAGLLPRSKKGDGVLSVNGTVPKVVVEMTDSVRTGWGDYLDEAERNRGAVSSLGIVRTPEQNNGQSIRVLGQRRVVIAFDPDNDDPEVLRTVVMLLRIVAVATTARSGAAEVATAEEKISEALTQLEKIDTVKKLAGTIQKNATKIDSECTSINIGIHRLLDEALVALAGSDTGAAAIADDNPASISGAA